MHIKSETITSEMNDRGRLEGEIAAVRIGSDRVHCYSHSITVFPWKISKTECDCRHSFIFFFLVFTEVQCSGGNRKTAASSNAASSNSGSSSVRGNVPVGADVKASVNFDCPEEFGYYPHPSDCTQYYVCVFGGALLESCTGGLMYR